MKKTAVLLLALILFAASAFAEEIFWADTESVLEESGRTGEFFTVEEAGVKLWVPDELSSLEVSDDYKEMFYVAQFADQDGIILLSVQYVQISFTDYAADVKANYTDVSEMTVNGINAVSIPIEVLDLVLYSYEMPDGHVLILSWEHVSRDDVAETCSLVTSSVQFQ